MGTYTYVDSEAMLKFNFNLISNPKRQPVRWASFCLVICNLFTTTHAATLRVAVASNFLETAQEVAHQFEQQSQHLIQLSSGSSGKLFVQISNGAPFDVFMSADTLKPSQLVKNKLAIPHSRQTYAKGKLALWLKNCGPSPSLLDLKGDFIGKIALANPQLAPYGLASKQLLGKHQLWSQLHSKIVRPENISQVAQLAKIGVVDAAFVALSSVNKLSVKNPSCILELQESDYSPIKQQLVIVSSSENIPLAKEFIDFLNSQAAHNLIKKRGYLLPDSDKMNVIDD